MLADNVGDMTSRHACYKSRPVVECVAIVMTCCWCRWLASFSSFFPFFSYRRRSSLDDISTSFHFCWFESSIVSSTLLCTPTHVRLMTASFRADSSSTAPQSPPLPHHRIIDVQTRLVGRSTWEEPSCYAQIQCCSIGLNCRLLLSWSTFYFTR